MLIFVDSHHPVICNMIWQLAKLVDYWYCIFHLMWLWTVSPIMFLPDCFTGFCCCLCCYRLLFWLLSLECRISISWASYFLCYMYWQQCHFCVLWNALLQLHTIYLFFGLSGCCFNFGEYVYINFGHGWSFIAFFEMVYWWNRLKMP